MAELSPATPILRPDHTIRVLYTNWRGEIAVRRICIDGYVYWGSTEHHPQPQWLVAGYDMDQPTQVSPRIWAVKDMQEVP